jgi:hypothetical protein
MQSRPWALLLAPSVPRTYGEIERGPYCSGGVTTPTVRGPPLLNLAFLRTIQTLRSRGGGIARSTGSFPSEALIWHRNVPHRHGLDDSPGRTGPTWGELLRARLATVLGCDFFTMAPCPCGGTASCSSSNSTLGMVLVTGATLIRWVSDCLISHSYQVQGCRALATMGPRNPATSGRIAQFVCSPTQ